MLKYFFVALLFSFYNSAFCQNDPQIIISGINDSIIKKSQLLDTSLKIVAFANNKIKGTVDIYFCIKNKECIAAAQVGIGGRLIIFRDILKRLTVGSSIVISDFREKNTGKKFVLKNRFYKIVDD